MANEFSNETKRVHNLIVKTMKEAMYIVQADTMQLCPVKTGALKRSYTSGVDDSGGVTGWVGSNIEYAVWADLKQPHLTAAVDQDKARITQMFTDALGD